MPKVCRILHSVNLNRGKYDSLLKQAKMLGTLRKEIWHRFGSINGVGANHREIRSAWVKARSFFPLPAKAWKETLRDCLDDIKLYEESAKDKVKKAIGKRTQNNDERKQYFRDLKGDAWRKNNYLRRMMRKHKKHGKTKVNNQIILEYGVYGQFTGKDGNTWLKVPGFSKGKPVAVPLNSNVKLSGCLRLILKAGVVYVHLAIEQKKHRACGNQIIGVDKGYSEAFTDSLGNFYGQELGQILTEGTEKRNRRGKARNKLFQLAQKKSHKQKNIVKFNLGTKKLEKNNDAQKKLIRNVAFQSVHAIVDLAAEIRAEDLSSPFKNKNKGKNYNRRMAAWVKGSLAEALESVTKARGSRLRLVNCAYTSQMDSNTGHLLGWRVGDKFYHANGEVTHADTNAALNIKHRGDDADITLYTPFKEVKKILLGRLSAIGGVSSSSNCDRPSLTLVADEISASTESELLGNYRSNYI
jgi:IS605 OrfB family transposase